MFRFVLLKNKIVGDGEKNENKRMGGRRDKEKVGSLKKHYF